MIRRCMFHKWVAAAILLSPCFSLVSEASLTPPKPRASKGTYSAYVKVTWSKVSKSKGYVIRRGTSSNFNSSAIIKKLSSASKTSFKDTSAAVGRTYYYWVCPRSSSTKYWYIASRYATGYRKGKATSSSASISGPSSLSIGSIGTYYLYVGGKLVTSSSVKWTRSGSAASLFDYGYYARLIPDAVVRSSATVTVKATYSGKTYSKKVTISGNVVPVTPTVTRYCSRHGSYKVPVTYVGCPYCKGEINW